MNWEDEFDTDVDTSRRAIRPWMAGPAQAAVRTPEQKKEIKRRIAIYASQVQRYGRITWLPHRGSGASA